MYAEGHSGTGSKRLPLNLLDALRALENSTVLREAFGCDFLDSYLAIKYRHWNEYCAHLTEWERLATFDC